MVIVSKQLTVPSTGKQLSDYAEGDIIKIPENGTPVEFYVAKHDYESSLNGAGRMLVVRKDVYDNRVWDNDIFTSTSYAVSDIDTWFNGAYRNMLDSTVRSIIGTTKIRYTPDVFNETVGTLERAVFALSATELGQSGNFFNVEGSALPIANTLTVAYLNGRANNQWTRSPVMYDSGSAVFLASYGNANYNNRDNFYGSRPAFTLPSTTKFDPNTNIIIG